MKKDNVDRRFEKALKGEKPIYTLTYNQVLEKLLRNGVDEEFVPHRSELICCIDKKNGEFRVYKNTPSIKKMMNNMPVEINCVINSSPILALP